MALWNILEPLRKRLSMQDTSSVAADTVDAEVVGDILDANVETNPQQEEQKQLEIRPLVRKYGFIAEKRKDVVTVKVDLDDEIVHFSLENVETTFVAAKLDRIRLMCEIDEDSHQISEVRRIEPRTVKTMTGRITLLEPGSHGVIDNVCVFKWNVLPVDRMKELNQNDKVKADCVECEVVGSGVYGWRCLNLTVTDARSVNLCNNPLQSESMNKNGIEMSENVEIKFNDINETKKFTMTVKNASIVDFKVIKSVFAGSKMDSLLKLISPTVLSNFWLKPGETKVYIFQATGKDYGFARDEQFTIHFHGKSTGEFRITRFISVCVLDREGKHNTIGTGRNVLTNYNYTRQVLSRDIDIVSGAKTMTAPNFVAIKFERFDIPELLQQIVLRSVSSRCLIFDKLDEFYPHLRKTLVASNYSQVFHDLLHLEECEMEHNIRKYDKRSRFTREKDLLVMSVQNVAETRPSLVIGDYVIATDLRSKENNEKMTGFRGTIVEVKQNQILLGFNEGFHTYYKDEEYQITFKFSRQNLKKQHHAIDLATKKLPSILFPDDIQPIRKQVDVTLNSQTGELQCGNSVLPWFNDTLNIIQKEAVTHILQGDARPTPYVIFGPPGTGKTITLIETILQIMKHIPHSRVLVATPSNSAANLMTECIVESGALKQNEFMRLVSYNKVHKDLIPTTIIRYSGTIDIARDGTIKNEYKVEESGLQRKCSTSRLKSYRLLIGTCSTLGTLMQCDFPGDHFTHVIIDESGQCLETEAIIPISFVDKQIGQIILAGDPMQLGPIVLSHFAKMRGLNQSFLARLLERGPYKPDPEKFERRYDPRLLTRLVYNYRSVPSIMSVYNDMFYDNDLKAMINGMDSKDAKLLKELAPLLPNNGQRDMYNGVVFFGVNGKNETCADSPSWYNNEEADRVVEFFKKLILMGQSPDDIGIITPYTKQVKTIRTKLQNAKLTVPKIGTVEEFQGQERSIILLSTVRTTEHLMMKDERYSLGFIKQPARMNVALSRARALLVIFGSPLLLSRDKNWKRLIDLCRSNKCAVNCDYEIHYE